MKDFLMIGVTYCLRMIPGFAFHVISFVSFVY